MNEKNTKNKFNKEIFNEDVESDDTKDIEISDISVNDKKSEKDNTNSFWNEIKKIFVKIGKWSKESILNMSVLISTSVMTILILVILIVIISRGGVDNKVHQTKTTISDPTENIQAETTLPTPALDELFTTEVNEKETGNYVQTPKILSTKMTIKSSWISDGVYYTQYNVAIKNVSKNKIDGWAVVVRTDNSLEITDNWNAQFKLSGKEITILPFPDNEVIDVGETINVGFVVSSYKYVYFNEATVFQNAKYETYKISVSRVQYPTTGNNVETTDNETTSSTENSSIIEDENNSVEGTTSGETSVGETSGEEPSGEEPSGEEPSGEEPSGEEPSGEDETTTVVEEPSGEEPTSVENETTSSDNDNDN